MSDPLPAPRIGDRSAFPDLEARAYLNHAAVSASSVYVQHAVRDALAVYGAKGVAAVKPFVDQRERLRVKLGRLLNCTPADIAFTTGTTAGLLQVALCLDWRPGDRVLLFRGEFPANVTPWQRAAELFGLELVWLDADEYRTAPDDALEKLDRLLETRVRLVAISAVQFQTGLRMPLEVVGQLCEKHDAELCVDAIQGCGALPIDVRAMHADFVACGAHKWMMGCEGAGFLYVRPERAGELVPRTAGWLSHEDGMRFLFEGAGHLRYDRPIKSRASFMEGGAANALGFVALEAALDAIQSCGVPAVFEHISGYLDEVEPALKERGFTSLRSERPEARSATLSVLPPDGVDVIELHAALGERGIACTIPDGKLRFAPHWPNPRAEIPVVLDAIDEALAQARR